MNNVFKLKKDSIKCYKCQKEYFFDVFQVNEKYFLSCCEKNYYENFNPPKKLINKSFACSLIVLCPLYLFIGFKFGLCTEIISVFMMFFGQLYDVIIDWICNKF